MGLGVGALGRVSQVGLGKTEHRGKGNAWENGVSRSGLGVGVGVILGHLYGFHNWGC